MNYEMSPFSITRTTCPRHSLKSLPHLAHSPLPLGVVVPFHVDSVHRHVGHTHALTLLLITLYLLNHSPPHSVPHLLTPSMTHSLNQSLTQSLTHSLIQNNLYYSNTRP